MDKQSITFEEVYDLTALRIVTDAKMNCYAVLGVIHSVWRPVPGPTWGAESTPSVESAAAEDIAQVFGGTLAEADAWLNKLQSS